MKRSMEHLPAVRRFGADVRFYLSVITFQWFLFVHLGIYSKEKMSGWNDATPFSYGGLVNARG